MTLNGDFQLCIERRAFSSTGGMKMWHNLTEATFDNKRGKLPKVKTPFLDLRSEIVPGFHHLQFLQSERMERRLSQWFVSLAVQVCGWWLVGLLLVLRLSRAQSAEGGNEGWGQVGKLQVLQDPKSTHLLPTPMVEVVLFSKHHLRKSRHCNGWDCAQRRNHRRLRL